MNSSARPPSQQKTTVEIVVVSSDESGRRLDNFLTSRLHGLPRARLYQMLRKGEVRVNGGRVKQDYRLQAGDKVRIPPVWLEPPGETASISSASIERLRHEILYEDSHLLVLNKPAGMAVHSGSGIAYGVIDIMRAARPDIERLELVHRLDRETSGCLLLAKDAVTLRRLHDQFRAGSIHKHYTALLKGRMPKPQLEVDMPLRKNSPRGGERMVVVDAAGKASATRLVCEQLYQDATLVNVELLTGRTHQIRVHTAAIEQPLAGDTKYGDAEFNKLMKAQGLKRLFLHAAKLQLPDEELEIPAPLPADLAACLAKLA